MHNRRRGRRAARVGAVAFALVTAMWASGCGATGSGDADSGGGEGNGLSIVATTTILGDVTAEVAGSAAEVTVLMEAGADPHGFEPSARQLAEMQQADLIVANGGNLEQNLEAPLDEAEAAGVPVFTAIDHIAPRTFGDGDPASDGEPHAEDAHDHGPVDPHFWMDPTRMAEVALALGAEIGELSGEGAAARNRAERYAEELAQLDRQIADMLSAVPADARTLVTSHEAFNYFADRYGFEVVGTVIPSVSTGAEPSARDLESLARVVGEEDVRAIFAENTAPSQLSETLARETGAQVEVVELFSDSLGPPGSGAETYIGMLETNARLVRDALSG